jgi:NTP pyrophosphatase (non-canonical NTP hydrolase)
MQVMKMLDQIKEYQAKLGYTYEYETEEERMKHTRELTLALMVEVVEFVEWTPWKPWREIADQESNISEAAFELVDIFFFMANLWNTLGIPTSSFEEFFEMKLKENLSRIDRGYNKPIEQLNLQYGDTGETL